MGFLHEHIILPLSDLAKGECVHKYLRLLREAEGWGDEQMKDFQQQRLRQLLTYAAKEVPFYRDWFSSNNIDPKTVTLDQLPVVSKALMRREGIERFTADGFPSEERIPSRSSGSTGEPFSFYITKLSNSVNTAAKLRTWYMAGYRLGDRYMKIANGVRGSKIKRLQDAVNNCMYIPFYSITDTSLQSILEKIERDKPLYIRSYPSPLLLLARYRNSHPLYTFNPRHIMTTGSTLTAAHRAEIEKAFGCDVIDSYSCEGTADCYETSAHDGYHVTNYYGIIEVLDDNNHPVTDGIGRVISTDLWNLAHPFIRYDTQDLVEVHNGKIKQIMGRGSDALVSANGTYYTVHNFSRFFTHDATGIDAYQIVRCRDKSIVFRLVINELYNQETERQIINFWQQKLNVNVSVTIVDSIPLMQNNKYLTIIDETAD